jgi:hypothetical protein
VASREECVADVEEAPRDVPGVASQEEAEAQRRAAYASGEAARERERERQEAIATHRAKVLRRQQEDAERGEQAPPAGSPPAGRDDELLAVLAELRDAVRELSAQLREWRGRG